ncbi:DUF5612 domain-containing protein [Methanosphaera stadtmanae]|uniref:DUF5612 domain-containing protein n=1 Tax=Methanosphaera stadtmanae TaxID=2317 RepID=UPI0026DAA04F|nr:DUF5612 domain-containing protein [Methanosphaera stadtmanae]
MVDAIEITTKNKVHILEKLLGHISKKGYGLVYTQFRVESENTAFLYVELENVVDIDCLISELRGFSGVMEVVKFFPTDEIWGKRIIIIGTGIQVSQVVLGAITEADRHNIRGERISVDTLPLAGEKKLTEAVRAVGCLPRVGCLVLAGSLMGGSIVDAIDEIKNKYGVKVISLNMVGSVRDHADLVVTDPVQAGVMAVMSIAKTAKFDIDRVDEVL